MQIIIGEYVPLTEKCLAWFVWEEYVSDGDHNEVESVEDRGDQHRGKAGSELPTRLTENQGNIIFQINWEITGTSL